MLSSVSKCGLGNGGNQGMNKNASKGIFILMLQMLSISAAMMSKRVSDFKGTLDYQSRESENLRDLTIQCIAGIWSGPQVDSGFADLSMWIDLTAHVGCFIWRKILPLPDRRRTYYLHLKLCPDIYCDIILHSHVSDFARPICNTMSIIITHCLYAHCETSSESVSCTLVHVYIFNDMFIHDIGKYTPHGVLPLLRRISNFHCIIPDMYFGFLLIKSSWILNWT